LAARTNRTLQRKLEESKQQIDDNQEVNKVYFEALTKVVATREAINRLGGFYNKEYASGTNNKGNESPA